jgi:hypothetical protein
MLLGQLYFNGEGVDKDVQMALYWYEKAAAQGFSDAQYRLGVLYFNGKKEIPKDYNKAYHWLTQALENGNQDAKPKLEGLFEMESGQVVNLHESPEVLQQVAATGNKQARYLLAEKLLTGTGVEQDQKKAINILKEDAKQGFIKAQKRLGELYFYGDGLEKDYFEAYAWSMAYAGTNELGGLIREGKQIARSALRKLTGDKHNDAYVKSQQYFNDYVLPYHKNARVVGPDDYRIVVRSRQAQLKQARAQTTQSAKQDQKTTKPAIAEKDEQDNKKTKSAQLPTESEGKLKTAAASKASAGARSQSPDNDVETKKPEPTSRPATGLQDSTTDQTATATQGGTRQNQSASLSAGQDNGQSRSAATEDRPQAMEKSAVASLDDSIDEGSEKPTPAVKADSPTTRRESPANGVADGAAAVAASMAPAPASVSQPTDGGASMESETGSSDTTVKRAYRDVYNMLVKEKSRMQLLFQNAYDQEQARPGRIVFDMVISPAGRAGDINVVSSELEAPLLEDALIDHLKGIDFGRKNNAEAFKISFPVDFEP